MDPKIHNTLLACDDEGFEVPQNNFTAFPYWELDESIDRLAKRIHTELNIDLHRDGNVQDASFHDDLRVLQPFDGQTNNFFYAFCIRFSNFGRLFTIFGSKPKVFATFPTDRVRQLVEEESWTYIPYDALQEPYDGVNQALHGVSWWIRYFDYL